MTHWLELSLTSTVSYLAGVLMTWYVQRGTCRSCRIRFAVWRLVWPAKDRIIAKYKGHPFEEIAAPVTNIMALAIAFDFKDVARLGWFALKTWLRMKYGNRNKRRVAN